MIRCLLLLLTCTMHAFYVWCLFHASFDWPATRLSPCRVRAQLDITQREKKGESSLHTFGVDSESGQIKFCLFSACIILKFASPFGYSWYLFSSLQNKIGSAILFPAILIRYEALGMIYNFSTTWWTSRRSWSEVSFSRHRRLSLALWRQPTFSFSYFLTRCFVSLHYCEPCLR